MDTKDELNKIIVDDNKYAAQKIHLLKSLQNEVIDEANKDISKKLYILELLKNEELEEAEELMVELMD